MHNVIKFTPAAKPQPSLESVLEQLDSVTAEFERAPCGFIQQYRDLGFSEFQSRLYAKQTAQQIQHSLDHDAQQRAAQKQRNVLANKQAQRKNKTNNRALRSAYRAAQLAARTSTI
jgi:hypothetical protein